MAQSKENTNNSARSKAAAAAQSTGAPAAQTGEKRPRTTRRLIITVGPAARSSPERLLCPSTSTRWAVWAKWART